MNVRTLHWKMAVLPVLFTLLLSVAGVTNATAQTFTVGNLNYFINEDGVSVTVTGHVDGTAATGELVIPESVELYGTSYPVTIIGEYAFQYCNGLTGDLVIPNSVITIGREAFRSCNSFTGSLTIGNAVQTIGYAAFYECYGFTGTLTLGNTVQTIDSFAFYNCSGFTGSLTIPESVTSINYYAFGYCYFISLNYNATSCTSVSSYWLSNTNSLTTVNIGENVQVIPNYFLCGRSTFSGELVIPNSVISIGNYAFENCTGFTGSLTIPNSVTTIGYNAFNGCTGFTGSLTIGNSVTSIGSSAFNGCNGFASALNIGNSVTSIGENAFNGCSGFTGSLKIPNSVLTIGNSAFNGCSGFTGSPTIGYSVVSIGENAFNGCSGFTGSLSIPNVVTTIGNSAFMNCTGFSGTLTLGQSLTEISNSAFFGSCEGFTAFNVLAEVPPTLGTNVFLSVNTEIPVYVRCGTLEAYQNAEGWNIFTNIQEPDPCQWSIAAVAYPTMGGTVGGSGVYEQGQTCTLVAIPNEGYVFTKWTEDNVEVSSDAEYAFTVTENRSLVAYFRDENSIGDGGTTTNVYLPSYSFYNYSLTQQIYTAEEIGRMGVINSVAFFNGGATKTRNYDIYLAFTEKNSFDNVNDWITVSETDKVFSGTVTMNADEWTTIAFDTSFVYNSASNLVLIVDDNTGSYTGSPHMACRVFETDTTQAIRIYSDNTNYDPYEPTQYNGTLHTEKNQIVLGFFSLAVTASVSPIGAGSVTGTGSYQDGDTCTLIATPSSDTFVFSNWTEDGEVVSTDAQYTFTVTNNRHLVANFIQVIFDITATANPEEGGTISGTGSYQEGQTCTLTATPNENYVFVNWTENDEIVSTEASYSFTVTGDRYLVANFAIPTYTITATANPTEGGTITFDGVTSLFDFEDGTLQGWTAIDADGDGRNWYTYMSGSIGAAHSGDYVASSWSWSNYEAFNPDNYLISPQITNASSVTYYVAVNSGYPDHYGVYASTTGNDINDFTLVFEETVPVAKENEGRAKVSIDGGGTRDAMTSWYERTIALPAGTKYMAFRHYASYDMNYLFIDDIGFNRSEMVYEQGSTCTMTAIPNYGYAFANWTEGGNIISTDAELSFTVTNDRDLVANFVQTPFTINAMPNFDDRGTVSGSGEYVINQTCTLIATPNEGHNFVHWMENGEVVSTEASYSFTVDGPRDLVAVFTAHVDDVIVFADPDTKYVCVNNWDTDGDGELTYDEAAAVTDLWGFYDNYDINSFDELQYFTGLSYIGDWTFEYCYYLSSIIIPNTVTSIGSYAFQHCGSLSSIVMPNSVTSIGDGAFYECYSLTNIALPENLGSIGNEAFRNCSGLRGELTLPESLVWVGEYAFASCDEISTVNYNATNCSVMGNTQHPVFYDCLSLEHINIGENVESIPNYAFKRCNDVVDINVAAVVPPTVGVSTFATISHSIPVYVPCGTSAAYQSASVWNEFTNIQEDCSQIQTQTVTLAAGWNWFSTNVEITLDDLKAALVEALPGTNITINSQSDGSTTYNGSRWRGNLNTLDVTQMYEIQTATNCEITLQGMTVNPAEHPATIHGDFNWIGFPLRQSMTLTNAFAGFVVNGDMVVSQTDGSSTYTNRWRGQLTTLEPGKGYMYKSNVQGDRVFTFPLSTK